MFRTSALVSLSPESTVAEAVAYWLDAKRTEVSAATWKGYRQMARYIVGPILAGSKVERIAYARFGRKSAAADLLPMLGDMRLGQLTTALIRQWQHRVSVEVTARVAASAKKMLASVLSLAAEDFGMATPKMPKVRGSRFTRKRSILGPADVARLLVTADTDPRGIYYTFPFFVGTRPSEQLGLLWDDVDMEAGVVHIRRVLRPDGTLSDYTKTAASVRDLPIVAPIDRMLREWRERCPQRDYQPGFVFPCLGNGSPDYKKRGHPLGYNTYLKNYWGRGFRLSGLAYVSPHTARHTYISTLQAKGVEIGLVAKLAGHASPSVTLGHYTLPVRGGYEAVAMLADAYRHDWN